MRPSGPEPATVSGSIPAPAASRLARGLIFTRRPLAAGAGAAGAGAAGANGAVDGAGPSSDGAGTAAAGVSAAGGASGTASPASPIQPHRALTGAVSPSATTFASSTPSSNVSTSIVLLSVSISNRTSPL